MVKETIPAIAVIPAALLDQQRWDQCVLNAGNGSVFAAYEYLSCMAPAWSGLVVGDYQAVLPLIHKSKFGVRYLAALPFVRQLGLIGPWNGNTDIDAVLKAVHGIARYGDICFNHANASLIEGRATARANFEIDLSQAYTVIYNGYHKALKKRLNQIHKENLLSMAPADSREVLSRYQAFLAEKTNMDLSEDFKRLGELMQTTFGQNHFAGYKVRAENGNDVLFGLYAMGAGRIYNFMTAVTKEGRVQNASAFALDDLIAKYAGSGKVLDFMGSSLSGVRRFIEGFGAADHPFYLYHFNHLPWPLRLFKR